jgi:predicted permease
MSAKKILLNPAVVSLAVAVPLFVSGAALPSQLDGMVTLLARMTTPLCMLIMGMRLATVALRSLFATPAQYLIVLLKGFAFPLLALGLLLLFPVEENLRAAVYIMMACPTASVVLNFAEMLGEGQETAANLVLLSTLFSALTIPVMVLIL